MYHEWFGNFVIFILLFFHLKKTRINYEMKAKLWDTDGDTEDTTG